MKLYFIIIIVCLQVSCRPTRNFSFEIMSPAKINLTDCKGKYLILNTSYIPDTISNGEDLVLYFPSDDFSISPEDKIILDTLITKQIFDGLFSILNESPIEGLYNTDYVEIRTSDTTGFLNPLSPTAVSEICSDYNTDYLVSFEYYIFSMDIESHPYRTSGGSYTYSAYCKFISKLIWRIYNNEGKVEDDYVLGDTLFWSNWGSDYEDAINRLPNTLSCIRQGFRIAGEEYGQRISPYWQLVNRLIYNIEDKTKYGKVNIAQDKFNLEIESLSKNKTKAYKACYNLAVLSESEGDIINAFKWIDKAMKNKNLVYARQYKRILKSREMDFEKLNIQIAKSNLN